MKTIKGKHVESWAIEITGDENLKYIDDIMLENGYVEIDRWEHYPGLPARTFDVIYALSDKVDYYKKEICGK